MAPPNEDVDVAAERKRTLRGSGRRDLIRFENLTKVRAGLFDVFGKCGTIFLLHMAVPLTLGRFPINDEIH